MKSPGRLTAMPSQIVFAERAPIGRAAASESMYGAHPSAWTPTTRTPSRALATASPIPLASPPPPSGTTTSFSSGAWRASSSPIVPCPATTCGWSNACTSVSPSDSASRVASAPASS